MKDRVLKACSGIECISRTQEYETTDLCLEAIIDNVLCAREVYSSHLDVDLLGDRDDFISMDKAGMPRIVELEEILHGILLKDLAFEDLDPLLHEFGHIRIRRNECSNGISALNQHVYYELSDRTYGACYQILLIHNKTPRNYHTFSGMV